MTRALGWGEGPCDTAGAGISSPYRVGAGRSEDTREFIDSQRAEDPEEDPGGRNVMRAETRAVSTVAVAGICAFLLAVLPAPVIAQGDGQEVGSMQEGASPPSPEPPVDMYRIGPRDTVQISVFQLSELNTTAQVSETGTIRMPVIGEVRAAGLTVPELRESLEEILSQYVTNPDVNVTIQNYRSQVFYLLGAVGSAGAHIMDGPTTLLEALARAGGVSEENAEGTVRILRKGFIKEPIEIDLFELLYEGNPAFNIQLQPGDTVHVVPKPSYTIYIYGAVGSGGAFQVRHELSLLQAITMAGGLTDRAAKDRIKVIRKKEDGTKEILEVSFEKILQGDAEDVPLQPDDMVIVPETFF